MAGEPDAPPPGRMRPPLGAHLAQAPASAEPQSFEFVPVEEIVRKLRMCIVGYEGVGKTFTAFSIARALVGPDVPFGVIDTEGARRRADGVSTSSSAMYRRRYWPFHVLPLTDHTPENYAKALDAAAARGYGVIVIDSLSHEYIGSGGLLEVVDVAKAHGGYGWDVATPRHRRVFEAIIASPAHVIATMRQTKEYAHEQQGGRTRMRVVGTKAVQREGAEFEFDLIATMDQQHTFTVTKSREMPDLPSGKAISRPEGALIADLATRSLAATGAAADGPSDEIPDLIPPEAAPASGGGRPLTEGMLRMVQEAVAVMGPTPERKDEGKAQIAAKYRELGYRDWSDWCARGHDDFRAVLDVAQAFDRRPSGVTA